MRTYRMMNDEAWNSSVGRLNSGALIISLLLTLFISYPSRSQIGIWQTHVSYQAGLSVAVVGKKVYAASQNGFFYYDKDTGETKTISKTDGLSDVGISRLLYLSDQKKLLIAYQNGNLDFMAISMTGEPDGITNVNTILAAPSLPAVRRINHLNRVGNSVYLSTSFGLVVLNILKNEIRDTYISQRPNGTSLPIFQTAITTDSLFALTGPLLSTDSTLTIKAVRFAPNVNISDPANWRTITKPGPLLRSIATRQGHLLATVDKQGVYEQQNGKWVLIQSLANPVVRLFSSPDGPILATNQTITLPTGSQFSGPLLANPLEVVADGNFVWVSDLQQGLLYGSTSSFQRILPNGPSQDSFANLYAYPKTLVPLAAPFNNTSSPFDFFSVPDSRWNHVDIPGMTVGFNSAAYLPAEQRLYLGSYGSGLWNKADDQSPTPVSLPAPLIPFVSSLATDSNGNLWIAASQTKAQQTILYLRRPDGQFTSFSMLGQTDILQIVPDDNGFLWLRPGLGSGLIVFDPATNRVRYLTTELGRGSLLTNAVRTLVKDRNGAIWVGTDLGPTVFDNPAGAFDTTIDAQPPLLNRRRLLANEVVTAIAVDGGNRKWIGTRTGLYLVSADGSQLLTTFTAQNSPLPVNTIQALAIEPVSGKLFIQTATDTRAYGLVSYQGAATEPAETLNPVKIFPNPVRPDFTGVVGINGLTANSTVKILDAGGQLVYETRSQGGTASWNLRDYQGRQAQTGIYLVVVITVDGLEGLAGKLAVIR